MGTPRKSNRPPRPDTKFGEVHKKYRTKAGISLRKLAILSGVDRSIICRWGKGDRDRVMCEAFHKQLADVIDVYIIDRRVITSQDDVKELLDAAGDWLGPEEYEEVFNRAIKALEAVAEGEVAPGEEIEAQDNILRENAPSNGHVPLHREAIQALLRQQEALVREMEARMQEDEEWLKQQKALKRQLKRLLKLEED